MRRAWPSTLADNYLEGTQALPVSMLGNPRQAYTWPDSTENRLVFVNGNGQHAFDGGYARSTPTRTFARLRTSGVNSNVNGDYAPPRRPVRGIQRQYRRDHAVVGCLAAGHAAARVGGDATISSSPALSFDAGTTDFDQSAQPATFVDDRDTVGIGPFSPQTAVTTSNRYAGVYVADTIALTRAWSARAVRPLQLGPHHHARIAAATRPRSTAPAPIAASIRRSA